MVSRTWLTTLLTAEESSTQVAVAFTAALADQRLLDTAPRHGSDALRAALSASDPDVLAELTATGDMPLLLAISDNAPQMRSYSTRELMAALAIAQQSARGHTPTDQAWIETLFGHLTGEWPHLEKIRDPGELNRVQADYNSVRLHASIGYLTPDDEHTSCGDTIHQARRDGLTRARDARITYRRTQPETTP